MEKQSTRSQLPGPQKPDGSAGGAVASTLVGHLKSVNRENPAQTRR